MSCGTGASKPPSLSILRTKLSSQLIDVVLSCLAGPVKNRLILHKPNGTMPYRHHTVPFHKDTAAYDHTASSTAFSSTATAHDIYDSVIQANRPIDYRPQMISSTTKTHNLQPVHQSHQQMEQRQHQRQRIQSRPTHKVHSVAGPYTLHKHRHHIGGNAVTTLLPYCTAEAPLDEDQIIAVTDVAGSLRELVLVALRAKDGDEEELNKLVGALGNKHAVAGVVDFFSDEFEVQ